MRAPSRRPALAIPVALLASGLGPTVTAAEAPLPIPPAPVRLVIPDVPAFDAALEGSFRRALTGAPAEGDPLTAVFRRTPVGTKLEAQWALLAHDLPWTWTEILKTKPRSLGLALLSVGELEAVLVLDTALAALPVDPPGGTTKSHAGSPYTVVARGAGDGRLDDRRLGLVWARRDAPRARHERARPPPLPGRGGGGTRGGRVPSRPRQPRARHGRPLARPLLPAGVPVRQGRPRTGPRGPPPRGRLARRGPRGHGRPRRARLPLRRPEHRGGGMGDGRSRPLPGPAHGLARDDPRPGGAPGASAPRPARAECRGRRPLSRGPPETGARARGDVGGGRARGAPVDRDPALERGLGLRPHRRRRAGYSTSRGQRRAGRPGALAPEDARASRRTHERDHDGRRPRDPRGAGPRGACAAARRRLRMDRHLGARPRGSRRAPPRGPTVRWARVDLGAARAEADRWARAEGPAAPERVRPFSDRVLGLLGWIPGTRSVAVERRRTETGWSERVVFGTQ